MTDSKQYLIILAINNLNRNWRRWKNKHLEEKGQIAELFDL